MKDLIKRIEKLERNASNDIHYHKEALQAKQAGIITDDEYQFFTQTNIGIVPIYISLDPISEKYREIGIKIGVFIKAVWQ